MTARRFKEGSHEYDAVIVGAGPNGLSAAVVLARAGWKVRVIEARETVGGGARTAELTRPGFQHDVCSAIYPLTVGSPYLSTLPLGEHGLRWIQPPVALAHPLDDGTAAVMAHGDFAATGRASASPRTLWPGASSAADRGRMGAAGVRDPGASALPASSFSHGALRPLGAALGGGAARSRFRGPRARALFAGLAGHSFLPLDMLPTAAVALVLAASGHAVGWPLPEGGAQRIPDALRALLEAAGGTSKPDGRSNRWTSCPRRAPISSISARRSSCAGAACAGRRATAAGSPATAMGRASSRSTGRSPVRSPGRPKRAAAPARSISAARARRSRPPSAPPGAAAFREALRAGRPAEPVRSHPRAGRQPTGWAYCHVPNGSTVDRTARHRGDRSSASLPASAISFWPGTPSTARRWRPTTPTASAATSTAAPPLCGQLFTRPVARLVPYATPDQRVFLCSASTPPCGGVHGMCGYHAAQAVLRRFWDASSRF